MLDTPLNLPQMSNEYLQVWGGLKKGLKGVKGLKGMKGLKGTHCLEKGRVCSVSGWKYLIISLPHCHTSNGVRPCIKNTPGRNVLVIICYLFIYLLVVMISVFL